MSFVPGDDQQAQPVVETLIETGIVADGIIADGQGGLLAAGGWLTDHVTRIRLNGETEILATGFNGPVHLVQHDDGTIFVSSFNDGTIKTISPEGDVSPFAQGLDAPVGMAFDAAGDLIVCLYGANSPGHSLARITPAGEVSTFANDPLLFTPIDIIANADGTFFVANQLSGRIMRVSAAGTVELIGQIPGNLGHMVILDGAFYATGGNVIYQITIDGQVSLFAGTGEAGEQDGPLLEATFRNPNGIAATADGSLLIIGATQGAPSGSLRRIRFP